MNEQTSKSKLLEEKIEKSINDLEKHMINGAKIDSDISLSVGSIIITMKEYADLNGYHKHPEYLGRISTILCKDYSKNKS